MPKIENIMNFPGREIEVGLAQSPRSFAGAARLGGGREILTQKTEGIAPKRYSQEEKITSAPAPSVPLAGNPVQRGWRVYR